MLAGKVTLLLRKTLKDFDHVVYDAVSKPKVQRTTKKVCGLVNQTSQHPHKTEVSRGLKPIETLGNVAVSIGEALSLGRVEPRRGEGHCGLRLFDLRRSKRKNPPLADARPSRNGRVMEGRRVGPPTWNCTTSIWEGPVLFRTVQPNRTRRGKADSSEDVKHEGYQLEFHTDSLWRTRGAFL